MTVPLWVWGLTVLAIVGLLALDFVHGRNPHEVSMREATAWSVLYVGVALAFGVGVWLVAGSEYGQEYLTAWVVEKSLSVDNLFVFLIIFARFSVPSDLQQRALVIGVALALVMRAVFIAIGAALLATFAFMFGVFGLFLLWTAVQLFRHRNEDADIDDNRLLAAVRARSRLTDDYHGNSLFVRIDGVRYATPMFLVLIAIGTTDLLFALDSIPATFGVTSEPYLVFTANAFALLGLRALYFVLRNLLERLVYLSTGLSLILGFIGVKLVLTYLHELDDDIPKIPTPLSLAVILTILVVTTVASLVKSRRDPTARAHSGAVYGVDRQEPAGRHDDRPSTSRTDE